MSKPRVYTYYEPIEELGSKFNELHVCVESWWNKGWSFEVLTERIAARSNFFGPLEERIRALPTLNHAAYERACYLRWCALDAVGGGLLIDYDMMNYGFRPDDLDFRHSTLLSAEYTPPIYVVAEDTSTVIETMLNFTFESAEHISDMNIFIKQGLPFRKNIVTALFGQGAWLTAPIVHYAQQTFADRALVMQHMRTPA